MITPSEQKNVSSIDDENTVVLRQNAKNQLEQNNNFTDENQKVKELTSPSVEINRLQITSDINQESMLQQPRNRLGLLFTPGMEIPTPISESTPIQTPIQPRSKQGSPFYAEPADALANNVIRRSQRGSLVPKTQRHSEPPKGPFSAAQTTKVISPTDSEKSNHISGSLDELKNKTRAKPPRSGRLDPWPVDSSWEFMGTDEQHDYDTDANWNPKPQTPTGNIEATMHEKLTNARGSSNQENRITVNQIIAKRLPELKISELLQKTALPTPPEILRNDVTTISFSRRNRLSAYDNVERGAHSGYATSMICHDSSHSDDGTVFSEPWDSSQWDSFMPHDGNYWIKINERNQLLKNIVFIIVEYHFPDTLSGSIHLSKCRPAICNSEDDTIMEESTFNHRQRENSHRHHQPQKVATILRSRSCRDREVLSKLNIYSFKYIAMFSTKIWHSTSDIEHHQYIVRSSVFVCKRDIGDTQRLFDLSNSSSIRRFERTNQE